jgi:hypothetical protein
MVQGYKLEMKIDRELRGEFPDEIIENPVLMGDNLSSSIELTYDAIGYYQKYEWIQLPAGAYRF